jgi:hypothetical protein
MFSRVKNLFRGSRKYGELEDDGDSKEPAGPGFMDRAAAVGGEVYSGGKELVRPLADAKREAYTWATGDASHLKNLKSGKQEHRPLVESGAIGEDLKGDGAMSEAIEAVDTGIMSKGKDALVPKAVESGLQARRLGKVKKDMIADGKAEHGSAERDVVNHLRHNARVTTGKAVSTDLVKKGVGAGVEAGAALAAPLTGGLSVPAGEGVKKLAGMGIDMVADKAVDKLSSAGPSSDRIGEALYAEPAMARALHRDAKRGEVASLTAERAPEVAARDAVSASRGKGGGDIARKKKIVKAEREALENYSD